MAYDQIIQKGATSQLIEVLLRDSSTGQGKSGVAAASVTAYYMREGAGANVAMTLDGTMALGTWKSLGWVAVDATNQPGLYQLGIPNAALATGANAVTITLRAVGVIDARARIVLIDADLRNAASLGLANLDAAVSSRNATTPPTAAAIRTEMDSNSTKLANLDATISSRSTYAGGAVAGVTAGVTLSDPNYTAARAAKLDNLDAALSTRSTYAGADTAGTTTLLARVPGTVQPQTGDSYARLGAPAGASHASDVAAVKADTGGLRTDYTTGRAGRLDNLDAAVSSRSIYAGGAVASVTNPITVGTNNDKTGYSLSVAPPTAAQVRQEIDANSTQLAAILAVLAAVPAAVWGVTTRTLSSFGTLVSDVAAVVWSAAARTLTAFGFTVAASSDAEVAAIKAKTDNLPALPAAVSDVPTAAQVADKMLGRNLAGGADGGRTVQDALRVSRNKVVVSGTTITVYAEDDTTVAWTGTLTTNPSAQPITAMDPA